MSYTVYMGSFSKRLNSTKQPTYSGWAQYSCVLKDETSLYRPTLRISGSFSTIYGYNYAVLFGRYYYIVDVRVMRTSFCEVDMVIDPLATFKSQITGTSAFIEYGFNTYDAGASGTRIPDTRISITQNPTMYTGTVDPSGGKISPGQGVYIVQAVGYNSNGPHKGLATFALDADQLKGMMASISSTLGTQVSNILNDANWTAQEKANELAGLSIKNELLSESAMAAIQSVRWIPLNISGATGTLCTLYLGTYSTGVSSAVMLTQNSRYSYSCNLDIPWPVTDWQRNNCQIILYLPFFGTIPLPTDQLLTTETLSITWTAEYFSGSISVVVRGGPQYQYVIFAGSNNISVDMGVGRAQVGASNLIGGGLQALGGVLEMAGGVGDLGASLAGAALGLPVGGLASSLSALPAGANQAFQGYAQQVQPVVTCAGSMGGNAALAQSQDARICLMHYPANRVSEYQAIYGHPVMATYTPANGYCKTRGFSVSLAGHGGLAAQINAIMDGGCFIE